MKDFIVFAKYNAFAGVFVFLFLTILSLLVGGNYSFTTMFGNMGVSVFCLFGFYFMQKKQ